MERCSRCQRFHGGVVCGIPAGVTLGFGARIGGVGSMPRSSNVEKLKGKPKVTKQSTVVLEEMLARANEQMKKVMEMLRVLPAEMSETIDLLDRESKLNYLIKQNEGQISVRRG